MSEWNYNDIIKYLDNVSQYASETGVWRGQKLLKQLGSPEKEIKIIHVAGSNGKGSVCAYMTSVMKACGMRTGMFTSPHLIDIRERIQVNGELIPKKDFCRLFMQVFAAEEQIKQEYIGFGLAYFDYLFGMACLYFQEKQVDYAVIETGLGGRLDASNAVEAPILSIITTISLEHTAILGDSLDKIAGEKAGIIKKGVPVVYCNDHENCTRVIKEQAALQGSKAVAVSTYDCEIIKNTGKDIAFSLHNEYYKNDCFSIAVSGLYQVMNASIALTALAVLERAGYVTFSQEQRRIGIKNMFWPGRMEEVMPHVYVDGAHNPQGIEAFVESVNSICSREQVISAMLLFSVVNDKEYGQMIHILENCRYFKTVLVTQTGGRRELNKERIASEFTGAKGITVVEFDKVNEAFSYGLEHREEFLFCAGSLYLAGEIREYLENMKQ